jgi:DNA polymerase III subunit delta'
VRFDPLPPARMAELLTGSEPEHARACAALALGDARLAARLAGEEGSELRGSAEDLVRAALAGTTGERPWRRLLGAARAAGTAAGEEAQERMAVELELLPAKERKRYEREGGDARRRGERRVRTDTLEIGLRLAELWLRDLLCIREGAPELVYAVDRRAELEQDAETLGGDGARLRRGIELVGETRLSLGLNVSEELALEALAYRLEDLFRG